MPLAVTQEDFVVISSRIVLVTVAGCQVGGHLKKGGKEDIFSRKGGQKEDIFSLKLIHKRQKQYQIYK